MIRKLLSQIVSTVTGATVPKVSKVVPAAPTVVPTRVGPQIAIINQSTVLSDQQVQVAVAALQIQLDRDFAPVWETNATLSFVSGTATPPPNAWQIVVLDTSDQAGALGYHDLTNAGLPLGKIFAKDDLKYGLSWSVTLSHELLEMLVDPYVSNVVFVQNSNTTGRLFAYEVCDAVEDDSYGYFINTVRVSDFVYPAWFEAFRAPTSTRFCQSGKATAPFQLMPGGYISTFVVGPNTTGWTQATAEGKPGRRLSHKAPGSRKDRRSKPVEA